MRAMDKSTEKEPVLEIISPNGEIIRIFQELSPEYMKELIEVFTERNINTTPKN